MSKAIKVFIVEGENRDLRFIEAITRLYIKDFDESVIINVPAAGNIYMLYEKMRADDFETDVIEVLRENIEPARKKLENVSRDKVTEVYLFFDADLHNNNYVGDEQSEIILNKMLSVFNNETDNGKLYISYPMVEALYDVREGQCKAYSRCFISREEFADYKRMAGTGNALSSKHFQTEEEWKKVIQAFYLRINCLYNCDNMSYEQYRELVSPLHIFKRQNLYIDDKDEVFVLSALPELLLDYFRKEFWEKYIDENMSRNIECEIER